MEQVKYVKVLNTYTEDTSKVGKIYEVIKENRIEYALKLIGGEFFYVHKLFCEPVEKIAPNKETLRKEGHYELWPDFEALDVMRATLSQEEYLGFLKGNILKYQLRLGKKEGEPVEKDLQKINTYKQLIKQCLNLSE